MSKRPSRAPRMPDPHLVKHYRFVDIDSVLKYYTVRSWYKEARPPNASHNGKGEQPVEHPSVDSKTLNSLRWKKFKSGEGEWTFLLGPDDSLLPELEPVKQFIERLRSEKEAALDGWHYRISKDRFLNRFPTQKTNVK